MFKKHYVLTIVVSAVGLATAQPTYADERGTVEEARALLTKAEKHYAEVGRDQALKDFSDNKGAYVDRDLYVGCWNKDGVYTAHGVNSALIGKSLLAARDADGKEIGKEFMATSFGQKDGEVEYKWPNPVSKKIEMKSVFIKTFGEDACGVGYYK